MRPQLNGAQTLAERELFARIERLARQRARKFVINHAAEIVAHCVVAECRKRLRAGKWAVRKRRDIEAEVRRMVKWRVAEQLRVGRPGVARAAKRDHNQSGPVQFVSSGGTCAVLRDGGVAWEESASPLEVSRST